MDKDKIISTIKDFRYDEGQKELLYEERKILADGKVKIESSESDIFIFDEKSDVIHADLLSNIKWDKVNGKDFKYPEKDYVKLIKDKYIPLDYIEEKTGYYTKEYVMYSFYKTNIANIFNPHDQIRVVFDNKKNAIILFDFIDDFKIKERPQVSESEAKEIADKFLSDYREKQSRKPSNITLEVVESNNFFKESQSKIDSDNFKESEVGTLHLAYSIEFEDIIVFVDAYNGEIIAGDSF